MKNLRSIRRWLILTLLISLISGQQAFADEKHSDIGIMYIPMEVSIDAKANSDDDDQFAAGDLVRWQVRIAGGVRGTESNPGYEVTISDNQGILYDKSNVYPYDLSIPVTYGVTYKSLGDVRACVTVRSLQTGEIQSSCKTVKIVKVDY